MYTFIRPKWFDWEEGSRKNDRIVHVSYDTLKQCLKFKRHYMYGGGIELRSFRPLNEIQRDCTCAQL